TLGGTYHGSNNISYYGDLSAILIENAPYWTSFMKTPKSDIALIDDWETKLAEITKIALQTNVTSFLGVPSWNLVLIKNILKEAKTDNLLDVWENLELFVHGGVSFTPYREQYKALIPSEKMNYMETYNASEGFFAIQDDLEDDSMLLMLDYGIFYEFIPLEEIHKEQPKMLTIGEVECGKNYAIVITTNAGLWRYMIGDTIQFTSLYPHKIKITGRTKLFINAFGEEVIIDNAEKALSIACEQTNAIVKEYTACPVFMGNNEQGTHEWILEFEQEPTNFDTFCQILDKALQEVNSDYSAKRYKDITLRFPTFHKAKQGLFYEWLKSRNKLGGQNKVPRLSNERRFVEELVAMNNIAKSQ
ncbi:MAG: GH3 auxin-responsive promoter family protein, partial [Flavobacteriaceae bacterium]|nr:GH3 auxin-responsive promoter family protein [Flavobacteriaceae bacterium]